MKKVVSFMCSMVTMLMIVLLASCNGGNVFAGKNVFEKKTAA